MLQLIYIQNNNNNNNNNNNKPIYVCAITFVNNKIRHCG